MSKYKAAFKELLRRALNIPDGELTSLINKEETDMTDADVESLVTAANTHFNNTVSSINKSHNLKIEGMKKELDDKFKAGQRNKAEEFEGLLKERFNVTSSKSGEDLIEEIVTQWNEKPSNKDKQITEDDVKKMPVYRNLEKSYKAQIEKMQQDHEKALSDVEGTFKKKEVFNNFSKFALAKINELNPVLSNDPQRAQEQKNLLLEKLASYDYEEIEPNVFIAVSKEDGKRITDNLGKEVEVDDLIKTTTTKYYDLKVATDRDAPNGGSDKDDKNKDTNNTTTYKGAYPKTEAEYTSMINDPNKSLSDKKAINEHWSKQQAAAN